MRKDVAILRWLFIILFALAGLIFLLFFLPEYPQARALADRLAGDGELEAFSPAVYQLLRVPALVIGFALAALAAGLLLARGWALRVIASGLVFIGGFAARLVLDGRRFLTDLAAVRLDRREVLLLGGLLLLALIARGLFVMRPFAHDEAYTVSTFAAAPLRESLSDYYLPNNHLFHTFLLHFSYLGFGYHPLAVRLPALLGGLLMIPALYLLARSLHGRLAAVVSAALAAAIPVLVDFSTNARGYTLVILFSLLLFTLGIYIRRRANLVAWALVVLVSVLGIYTIPVFYLPYASFLLWLGLAFLIGDLDFEEYGSRWRFAKWAAVSGVITLVLTLLLYTPVFLRFGVRAVIPTQVGAPMSYSLFMEEARVRLTEGVHLLMTDLPVPAAWLLAAGFVLSLILPLRSETVSEEMRVRIPLQIPVLLGTFGLIFALRAPPWARFLIFLVPLILMWAAAGYLGLLRFLRRSLRLGWNLEAAAAGLVLVGVLVGTAARVTLHPLAGWDVVGPDERVVLFLKDELRDQELVVVSHPHDANIWYYSRRYGISMDHYRRELPFFRAFVLINPSIDQTMESVMEERMPDTFLFDLDTARLVYQAESLHVYELIPNADLVRKTYGLDEN